MQPTAGDAPERQPLATLRERYGWTAIESGWCGRRVMSGRAKHYPCLKPRDQRGEDWAVVRAGAMRVQSCTTTLKPLLHRSDGWVVVGWALHSHRQPLAGSLPRTLHVALLSRRRPCSGAPREGGGRCCYCYCHWHHCCVDAGCCCSCERPPSAQTSCMTDARTLTPGLAYDLCGAFQTHTLCHVECTSCRAPCRRRAPNIESDMAW